MLLQNAQPQTKPHQKANWRPPNLDMCEIISEHQWQGVAGQHQLTISTISLDILSWYHDRVRASDSPDKLVVILQYNYIIGIKFYIYCLLCLNNVTLEQLVPESTQRSFNLIKKRTIVDSSKSFWMLEVTNFKLVLCQFCFCFIVSSLCAFSKIFQPRTWNVKNCLASGGWIQHDCFIRNWQNICRWYRSH